MRQAGRVELAPWDVWGQSSGFLGVSGESHYEKQLRAILGGLPPSGGTDVERQAILVPDPTNRFDSHAVKVTIDGLQVGFVPAEHCAAYGDVLRHLASHGRSARVGARIRGYSFTDYDPRGRETTRLGASVTLRLAEPHLLMPLTARPAGRVVELPPGRKQRVAVDEVAMGDVTRWARPEGAGWVHTTLHRVVDTTTRSEREVIGVRVDGVEVGRLTPAMSKNYLPLVSLTSDRGLVCVARGLISGNLVTCDLTIVAAKASEVSQGWLDKWIYPHPPLTSSPSPPEPGPGPREPTTSDSEELEVSRADDIGADPSLAPGFYPDPQEVADLRFWDGSSWTTRIRMHPR